MLSLLSPRFLIGLAISIAFALSNGFSYKAGRAAVRVEWDKERAETVAAALVASQAARTMEQVLNTANQKVTNDYNTQKKLRAADAVVSAGKLRDLQLALGDPSGTDTAADARDYGDPRSNIVAGCASTVIVLDQAVKRLADQTAALQRYTVEMRLAK